MGDLPGLSVRHSCAKSLCFGGVRCGVLWHETAGQSVSGAAKRPLSYVRDKEAARSNPATPTSSESMRLPADRGTPVLND